MNRNRKAQFEVIEKAKQGLLTWAISERIGLFQVEFIVPFVETDFSLFTLFFYKTEKMVTDYKSDGTSDRVIKQFIKLLATNGYAKGFIPEFEFEFDSDENVQKNFGGSYFGRLR